MKEYIITALSSQAAPFNIYIYQLPELPIKLNTSLAEYYVRQQYFGNLSKFKANYYIDNLAIWHTMPAQGKIIRVALCGDKQRTKTKAARLVARLAKGFSIPQEQIFMHFENPHFAGLLSAAMQKIEVPHIDFSHYDYSQESAAKEKTLTLSSEVYLNRQWTQPTQLQPITGLRIHIPTDDFYFRIWQAGGWSAWTSDCAYSDYSPIEGFQFEFNEPGYELKFRVHFKNSNWTPWKTKSMSIPYKRPIDNIEFQLIKEGET